MLEERSIEVPERLRPWISGMVVSRARTATLVREPPDHATEVVVWSAPGRKTRLTATGPRTRPLYYPGGPGPSCLRVRLRPGLAPSLLGRSMRGLADRAVPLGELLESVEGLVQPAGDHAAFAEALVARAPTAPHPHAELIAAAAELVPVLGVRASAERLHLSERRLRELFVELVGLPPKRFARIDRVRSVLERGASGRWSELALDAGYVDHSHLTADFRAFMGVPPTAYFGGAVAPNVHCPGPLDAQPVSSAV